jgi:pyruvate formate lyase activating enzyme
MDPIEKKPLYHYKPGSLILSVGSFGCNFCCGFCQNHTIALGSAYDQIFAKPEMLVSRAKKLDLNIGIAYTYNEPTVYFELMVDTASAIKNAGLDNVMVSNGFINPEPLRELIPLMDAANIDLKAYDNQFYKKYVRGHLEEVKRTIVILNESKVHLEITHLLIQGFNDNIRDFTQMCQWISDLNSDIPLHISRYYPAYKFTTHATDVRLIKHYADVARKYLNYVYIGNVAYADNNTYCPQCHHIVIRRTPYLDTSTVGHYCENCGALIPLVL